MDAPYLHGQPVEIQDSEILDGTGLNPRQRGYFMFACPTSRYWLNNYWKYKNGFLTFANEEACLVGFTGRGGYVARTKGVDRPFPQQQHDIIRRWRHSWPLDKLAWLPSEVLKACWSPRVGEHVRLAEAGIFSSNKYFISDIVSGKIDPSNTYEAGFVDIKKENVMGISIRESLRSIIPMDDDKMEISCQHEWVNVGFYTLKMVCKYCDAEK
jgi:hypothetical protein